jgi:hypothetical protein
MLIIITIGHINACIFWLFENLIPGPDRWIDTNHLLVNDQNETVDFTSQYVQSYLSSLFSLVLEFRSVTLNSEKIYVMIEFVFGILCNGAVIGNIHSIFLMMDESALSTEAGKW